MRKVRRTPLAAACFFGGLGLSVLITVPDAVAASPKSPTITSEFNSVVVNTKTLLRFRHFAPNSKQVLYECPEISWVGIAPCHGGKVIRISPSGAENAKVTAVACATQSGPSQTCYFGIVRFGSDRGHLRPYVAITVTFPS
jgi:hypothetical protein